jgi:hypothetical protein
MGNHPKYKKYAFSSLNSKRGCGQPLLLRITLPLMLLELLVDTALSNMPMPLMH